MRWTEIGSCETLAERLSRQEMRVWSKRHGSQTTLFIGHGDSHRQDRAHVTCPIFSLPLTEPRRRTAPRVTKLPVSAQAVTVLAVAPTTFPAPLWVTRRFPTNGLLTEDKTPRLHASTSYIT